MPSGAERWLVTGGAGFLGAALVRSLLADGVRVRVLDDGSRGHARRLAELGDDVERLAGDVRDPASVARAMDGVDVLCHLAAINGTRHFYERPYDVLDVGVRGTLTALDAAAAAGVRDVLFMSSSEVYQVPPVVPTPEDVPATIPDVRNPRYSYAGSKLIGEQATLHHPGAFARRLIVRPHNVYGPDMGEQHVIPAFILRTLELLGDDQDPLPFPIQGTGEETRAFVYVEDFIDGLACMLDKGEHLGIYNIGTMEETSIADLALAVGRRFDRTLSIVPSEAPEGECSRRCPDIAKLRALGYSPRHTLDEGLELTARWYEHQQRQTSLP